MSLFGSLSSGVTGLISQGEAISVISDNLANVNTVGYKGSKTLFAQLVTSSGISGTQYNAGGVGTNIRRAQTIQGSLKSTQSSTDLALSGNGFFVVTNDVNIDNETTYFYTRAGAFAEDNRGYLTTPAGQYLLGWKTDQTGRILDRQNPRAIELQTVGASAKATEEFNVGVNLTSTEEVHGYDTTLTLQQNLDAILTDPTRADYVTDARFYDSQGGARDVTIAFTKRSDNLWDWQMFTDGMNVVGGSEGVNTRLGSGTLQFNENGSLRSVTGSSITANWSGGVETATIGVNFGGTTGGVVFDETTSTGTLNFAGGVLGMTLDETDANYAGAGTYTVAMTSATQIQITGPDAVVYTVDIGTSPSANARTVNFGNGVTLSLSAAFTPPAGPYPAAMGTIDTAAVLASGTQTGTDGMIQFSSSYNTLFSNQDGYGSGTLSSVTVDEEGFLIGSFTNGETKRLWKLTVAVFQNQSALDPVSQNLMRETDASGPPLFKEAGVGGTATIVSGALEQSTVDIANEFSEMIVSQRAYQASSTVVSTVDQMLNELMQLR